LNTDQGWRWPDYVDRTQFDWSWHPDRTDPAYIYQFPCGSQGDPGPRYTVPGGRQIKYLDQPRAEYRPLDIMFVSAGETGEQARYDRLCAVSGREVRWIQGVQGRENALRAAAEQSQTDWFLVFPGKLWADQHFDFGWQPTRKHQPKHYIFYAQNPVNHLQYGHQAAVAYNRDLVLNQRRWGLDFTMSAAHDIVPLLSGVAQYDSDIWMCWRTAFREAIKLRLAADAGDQESLGRLLIWQTVGQGDLGWWSRTGTQHGLDYYAEVSGEAEQLQASFAWSWLRARFAKLFDIQFES
jgi:hypothetical protein